MTPIWLEQTILRSARSLETGGAAAYRFEEKIAEILRKAPIQEWEADRWMRGIKLRLIRNEDYFFRVGTGKRAPLSLFVRNEQGLNVGLRRESITQMATYITLVTDYGYTRAQTRFESQWMDVAVYDEEGDAWIYAENKATLRILDKLCRRLENEFSDHVPFPDVDPEDLRRHDDPLMKAQHIWTHRPRFFWAVCPGYRQAYEVRYTSGASIL